MYLLIDNYDSFTYNLADLVVETERDVQVCRYDRIGRNEIAALKPQGLIISPHRTIYGLSFLLIGKIIYRSMWMVWIKGIGY